MALINREQMDIREHWRMFESENFVGKRHRSSCRIGYQDVDSALVPGKGTRDRRKELALHGL